jgi:urease subunit alpha
VKPGELLAGDGPVPAGRGGRRDTVRVRNDGRFDAYLGSHAPLTEASGALHFSREGLEGARPALPAGATVRIPAGEEVDVEVVWPGEEPLPAFVPDRRTYAALYGPTAGDRIRLGDTDLLLEVEADDTEPGSEPLVGFAKTVRAGQLAAAAIRPADALDVAITNVVVLDALLGVRKTSIGIKDGRIAAVGRAGNPEQDEGVDVPLSAATGIVPGEGLIATAGAVDSHVHLLGPQIVPAALSGGTTTVVAMGYGGAFDLGVGPHGNFDRLLDAWRVAPLNLLPLARASTTDEGVLEQLLAMGAGGFKVHEDVGASPGIVAAALAVAERADVQLALHADGIGEAATLEETLAAVDGRGVHLYHVEGCGGGPVNLLEAVALDNVLPSSTNPTIPLGVGAVAEHEEMIRTVHRLNPLFANDLVAARGRIRDWTMAAESVLHEFGAISMTSSDSMGMGRIGEVTRRTWQLAHVMKRAAGASGRNDNERILRYVAKLTVNPALAHGIAHEVGSLMPGKLADIVLWRPAFFGVKPQLVVKAGFAAWAPRGSGSGSTRIGEPLVYGELFGGVGAAPASLATVFASRAGADRVLERWPGPVAVVENARGVRKRDLVRNAATPEVVVDPGRRVVLVDGKPVRQPPADALPLNWAYSLA